MSCRPHCPPGQHPQRFKQTWRAPFNLWVYTLATWCLPLEPLLRGGGLHYEWCPVIHCMYIVHVTTCKQTDRYTDRAKHIHKSLTSQDRLQRLYQGHCGYRRYFSSQGRCKAAVLLCTGGGLLSLVNTCGEIGLCTPRVEAHPPRGGCEWRPPMGGRRPPPPGVWPSTASVRPFEWCLFIFSPSGTEIWLL